MDINGLGVTRSLGRLGITVFGIDWKKDNVGFYSKYCRNKFIFSHPALEDEKCAEELLNLGKNLEAKGVIFPTADYYVILVAKYQKELSKYFLFNIPRRKILDNIVDKKKQYKLAEKHGIPIAQTIAPKNISELNSNIEKINYPVIIKGVSSFQWQASFNNKCFMAKDYDELKHFFQLTLNNIPIVIQEIIPGPNKNHYKVCCYYSKNHKLLALFSTQKTRQYPVDFGVGSYMASGYYPELIKLARRFFEGINFTGIGSIEFKKDERDGQFKLIELNPRLWAQNIQAAVAGVNFPLINYLDCIGEKVEPILDYNKNICWQDAIQDFQSFLGNRKKGDISIKNWFRSILQADCFAYFAWDDLRPGWKNSGYFTKYFKLPIKLFSKNAD